VTASESLLARLGRVTDAEWAALQAEIAAAEEHLARLLRLRSLVGELRDAAAPPAAPQAPARRPDPTDVLPPAAVPPALPPPPDSAEALPPKVNGNDTRRPPEEITLGRPDAADRRRKDAGLPRRGASEDSPNRVRARERREKIVRYLHAKGPSRQGSLNADLGVPYGSMGQVLDHPWFDKDQDDGLVHLTPRALAEVLGKNDDE
jgi:hypothetical protein